MLPFAARATGRKDANYKLGYSHIHKPCTGKP